MRVDATEWRRALDRMAIRVQNATQAGTTDAGRALERAVELRLRVLSHPAGTPTPSRPRTSPPAMITGGLARSVYRSPTSLRRRGVYATSVGPTAVQARIQELGGQTGRDHRTLLPPRPYLKPVTRGELVNIRHIYAQGWREATRT